ncbi:LysE family translocator [Rhizohabitans arisaemae]|uniref:LysE family translocator n=1 Tax=Rhizohabitans arisaemae TaxID=2720610 RepID=UPI0024B1DBE5|nr:LysE family translocator [Rhizohabitans arisaemae]
MPSTTTFITFAIASLALALVPGPAVVYVLTRSVSQGRNAGLVSALGIHTGTLVHIVAAVIGLSSLIASSAIAFSVIKYAGAAYLVYIGVRAIMTKETLAADRSLAPIRLGKVYREGILVNVLNPKTALFFLAFLPQFVDPSRGNAPLQILLLGATFFFLAMISDSLYALVGGALRGHVKRFFSKQRLAVGGVYITLGITAALADSGR